MEDWDLSTRPWHTIPVGMHPANARPPFRMEPLFRVLVGRIHDDLFHSKR